MKDVTRCRGVATGGISVYIPPPLKSVFSIFLCGCFVSLTQDKFIYTHPNQIPGYVEIRFDTRELHQNAFEARAGVPQSSPRPSSWLYLGRKGGVTEGSEREREGIEGQTSPEQKFCYNLVCTSFLSTCRAYNVKYLLYSALFCGSQNFCTFLFTLFCHRCELGALQEPTNS